MRLGSTTILRSGLVALIAAMLVITCSVVRAPMANADAAEARYLSPGAMLFSPDGRRMYVVAERGDQLLILDAKAQTVSARIAVGHAPRGLAISPDGTRLYVTNSWDDTVSVIDTKSLAAVQTLVT